MGNVTILFYISAITAILSAFFVITHNKPVHALLFLIILLLSISCNFFVLGAFLAGVIEIIVYAGAIMILFLVSVMMLNTDTVIVCSFMQDCNRLNFVSLYFGIFLPISILLLILLYAVFVTNSFVITTSISSNLTMSSIGTILFTAYVLIVEMASFLLLSALIVVSHLIQDYQFFTATFISNRSRECEIK